MVKCFFPNRPLTAKASSNVGRSTTQTMSGDCLTADLERVIEKKKNPKEEIAPDENIIFSLPKIPTILDNEEFEIKREIKKQKDNEINEEIDLTRIKDGVDAEEIPPKIEFYFGGENYNFSLVCSQLSLNKDNESFDFLPSDIGSQILRRNMLLIHIKTGNILYENYNK